MEKHNFKFKKQYIWLILPVLWIMVFTFNRVMDIRVGTDYDDTLSFSTPAFRKALSSNVKKFTPPFWKIVYDSVDLEKPKRVPVAVMIFFRAMGIRVDILTARDAVHSQPLEKKMKWLAHRIYFGKGKAKTLSRNRYLVFFGDSDSDIRAAKKAHVFPVRVRRNPTSSYKKNHHPGDYGEWILPFSVGPGLSQSSRR